MRRYSPLAACSALLAAWGCGCGGPTDPADGGPDSSTPDASEAAPFVEVNSYGRTSCARRSDGIAGCWGEYFPEGVRFEPTVDAVSAGFVGAFVLRAGAIEYVTSPETSDIIVAQFSAPPGRYLSIATKGLPCAVTEGRDVRCWGRGSPPSPPPLDPPFVSVVTGGQFACVETEGGSFGCWSQFDMVRPPALPDRELMQVVPGTDYVCGLYADGEAECWSDMADRLELLGTPEPGPFVQIDAGSITVCGLRENGTIACWGAYSFGDLEPPDQRYSRISVGSGHICAITVEGSLSCWGDDTHGQASPPQL